jgi:hypothetical protein
VGARVCIERVVLESGGCSTSLVGVPHPNPIPHGVTEGKYERETECACVF